jgi:hypothetical protein
MGIRFDFISIETVAQSGHFDKQQYIQSSLRALSIDARQHNDEWKFRIYQGGFRSELIPEQFNAGIKKDVIEMVMAYVFKVQNSIPTDGFISPHAWVHVMLTRDKPKISFIEHKK